MVDPRAHRIAIDDDRIAPMHGIAWLDVVSRHGLATSRQPLGLFLVLGGITLLRPATR